MKLILFTLWLLLIFPLAVPAAEVINLKVGQSGDKGFATYDLSGKIGEREAEVVVSLTINGEKYAADKLTLNGDFGKKVKTGVGRRIIWDILSDIPIGFDGEVVWNVDAVGDSAPVVTTEPAKPASPHASKEQPFEFSELVARDKNTGLLWLREVSRDGNGTDLSKARGFAKRLKTDKFASCTDWRLPFVDELTGIVTYGIEGGYKGKKSKGYPADYFNAIGFRGVANDFYWTESIDTAFGFPHEQRMAVDLEDGVPSRKSVSKDYLQFWPVCKPD